MIRVKKEKKKSFIWDIIISAVVFVAVICAANIYISRTADISREQGAQTLRDAIDHAIVQCYAIEGRYPPNVAYLQEKYGIQIDFDRYDVFYDGFASNIKPEITVNVHNDEEPDWKQ